jgi:hypothetical protein
MESARSRQLVLHSTSADDSPKFFSDFPESPEARTLNDDLEPMKASKVSAVPPR